MQQIEIKRFQSKYLASFSGLLVNVWGRFLMSCLLFVFVLLTTYPKYIEIILDPSPEKTHAYFFEKIKEPLGAVDILKDTHGAKIAFRLTVPVLAKILPIGINSNGRKIVYLFLLQSLLLLPFFIMLIEIFRRFFDDASTVLILFSFASVYTTKAFFWDCDFWFDGFAYFFLLTGMFSQNRLGIFLALQLACWTDERAVIALASIYLFHLLQENNFDLSGSNKIFKGEILIKKSTAVIYAGLFYLIIRMLLTHNFDLHTPNGSDSGVSLGLIPIQLKQRLIGIFLSFEGLWLFFLSAIFILIQKKKWPACVMLIAILSVQIVVAYSVFDISRSLAYAFPILIIAAIITYKNEAKLSNYIFFGAATLCMIIPTQYLIYIPRQIPLTILSYDEIKPVLQHIILTHP